MGSSLLQLIRNTILYSGAQGFSKLLTFAFLPITTAYLSIEDYGTIAALLIFGQLVNGIFTLGFGTTLFKYYSSLCEKQEKEGLVWACFTVLLVCGVVLCTVALLLPAYLSWIVFGSADKTLLIAMNVPAIALGAALVPLTAYLRIEDKLSYVFWLSVLEGAASALFVLYFLIVKQMGVLGVALGGLVGQSLTFIIVLLVIASMLPLSFNFKPVREMLRIGLPYMFGVNGYLLAIQATRYLLQGLAGLDQLGLFFMGSNFARGMELLVMGLTAAWGPLAFKFFQEAKKAQVFISKAAHYYIGGTSIACLGCFAFAKPIIYTMVHPSFWPAWTTVGIVGLAYGFWGAYVLFSVVLLHHKKSWLQVCLEAGTIVSCILANVLVVPFFQREGAAAALCLSCALTAYLSYSCARRLMAVHVDTIKILKLTFLFILIAGASFFHINDMVIYTAMMACLFFAFIAYVWFFWTGAVEKAVFYRLLKERFSR